MCIGLPEPSAQYQKSHVLAQMAICVYFMRAVKALASLHICTGLSEPSSQCVGSNCDFCAVHASSEDW